MFLAPGSMGIFSGMVRSSWQFGWPYSNVVGPAALIVVNILRSNTPAIGRHRAAFKKLTLVKAYSQTTHHRAVLSLTGVRHGRRAEHCLPALRHHQPCAARAAAGRAQGGLLPRR